VYTGGYDGRFCALNSQTGALLWQTGLTGSGLMHVRFFFEDGIAYFAAFDSSGGPGSVLYAIDLASRGEDAVSFTSPYIQYTIFGMETGYNDRGKGYRFVVENKNVFLDFSLLATDPAEFVTKSFADIITLIKDILLAVLQLLMI